MTSPSSPSPSSGPYQFGTGPETHPVGQDVDGDGDVDAADAGAGGGGGGGISGVASAVVPQLLLAGGWPLLFLLIPVVLLVFIVLLVVIAFVADDVSVKAADFNYQCDSALGPDLSATATSSIEIDTDGTEDGDPTDVPTTNPYAGLTDDPDAANASPRQQHCITAMQNAVYQLPARHSRNSGFAVECARDITLEQVGKSVRSGAGGLSGPSGDALDSAQLPRYVLYQASLAVATRSCSRNAAGADAQAISGAAGGKCPANPVRATTTTTAQAVPVVVVLPETVAAQSLCGQRVAPSAISPGDLVFWDYRNETATRVGVAVSDTQMVTGDSRSGKFAAEPIPTDDSVRVKRFLSR